MRRERRAAARCAHDDASVLARRARALAEPQQAREDAEAPRLLLLWRSSARYGVAAQDVVAVTRAGLIAPWPQAPPALRGVAAWRGHAVPVMDLPGSTAGPSPTQPQAAWLAILRTTDTLVGVLADEVEGVGSLRRPVGADTDAASPTDLQVIHPEMLLAQLQRR